MKNWTNSPIFFVLILIADPKLECKIRLKGLSKAILHAGVPSFFHLPSVQMASVTFLVQHYERKTPYDATLDYLDQPVKDFAYAKTRKFIFKNANTDQQTSAARTRTIISEWPTEPGCGKPRVLPGKLTPDKTMQLWGETLLDFYHISPLPQHPGYTQIATSSKLANWAKQVYKTEVAAKEIRWASHEGDPQLIEPFDVVLASCLENMNVAGPGFKAGQPLLMESMNQFNLEEQELPASIPEPFDYTNYPRPWPLVPFTAEVARLQSHVDICLLPQRLHVHDPDAVVEMRDLKRHHPYTRAERWPIDKATVTYELSLEGESLEKIREQRKERRAKMEQNARTIHGLIIHPDPGSSFPDPPLFLVFPTRPSQPDEVQEAHLYLDCNKMMGIGNHSRVYDGELELPLPAFSPPEMCHECVLESATEAINDTNAGHITSSEYQFWWNPSQPTPHSHFTIPERTKQDLDDDKREETSSRRTCGTVHIFQFRDERREVGIVDARTREDIQVEWQKGNQYYDRIADGNILIRYHPIERTKAFYAGPLRVVHSNIPWDVPGISLPCKHKGRTKAVFLAHCLPTMKVAVAAKLSSPYDAHLEREATNYQNFPPHFFQHWSGYFIVPPLHDPVPCGAIVPQFYGYYQPEQKTERYQSAILLIENCGEQIRIEELTMDERHECSSIANRMHISGWVQQSIAERNFVVQEGPVNAYKLMREFRTGCARRIFRLIDFGRAREVSADSPVVGEEIENTISLFQPKPTVAFSKSGKK